jgi:hypothetical protein
MVAIEAGSPASSLLAMKKKPTGTGTAITTMAAGTATVIIATTEMLTLRKMRFVADSKPQAELTPIQAFSPSNLIDSIFGTDYECVLQAQSRHQEDKNAEQCCEEVGGETYGLEGHVRQSSL